MDNLELYLLVIGFLMLLSVISSKISDKFGVPVLIIFLALGMLAGSDGILGIHFDNASIAQSVGTIALIFILFGGGVDTSWKLVRPVVKDGILLATFGVILTALLTAVCVYFVFDFTPLEAFLLGSIVSSTDAAAVFAILRAKGVSLKKPLAPLLELESGSNDPMAIFLTIVILQMILLPSSASFGLLITQFFLQFLIGGVLGYLFGILMPSFLKRVHFGYYGLYPVFSIAWVLLLFSITSLIGGNGFLAVYIAGICINAREFIHKKNLISFHDGLAWLMQIVVFLTLGLLVFPSELPSVAIQGSIIALWLIFVARPIGVFLTLIKSKLSFKEKSFVSWVGLRGAVPIVLATFPFLQGYHHSSLIFNTVFFVVLFSVLLQGMSLTTVAKFLNLEDKLPINEKKEECQSVALLSQTLRQLPVSQVPKAVGQSLCELELPEDFLVVLVIRNGKYIKVTGSMVFEKDDILVAQSADQMQIQNIISQLH